MKFSSSKSKRRKSLIIFAVIALFILGLVVAGYMVRRTYQENLKPLSSTSKTHVVTIEEGSSTAEIADVLYSKGVIKSDWAFEWYVRNEQLRDQLKAGTYSVDQSQSVQQIVGVLVSGKVATNLVTILPGKRLDETKKDLLDAGFSQSEIDQAFNPELYVKHPALSDKPKSASLEGYVYPETFQMTADTSLEDIINLSLDELDAKLTPEVRRAISEKGLTIHEAVTLASIIEGEVTSNEDRAQVAQVFIKRMKEGVRLESNATDEYSEIDPAYNTYKIDRLPPGPVSNFTASALTSIAYPAQTDWMYFVSGDDKKTHFSRTFKEHEANIEKYCTTLCGR